MPISHYRRQRPQIIVKFDETTGTFSQVGDQITAPAGIDLGELDAWIAQNIPGSVYEMSFARLSKRLDELQVTDPVSVNATLIVSKVRLGLFLRVIVVGAVSNLAGLAQDLASTVRRVEYATVAVPGGLPPYDPLMAHQVYLGPHVGNGVEADVAWDKPGGTGAGVTVCVIDENFRKNHEDLPAITLTLPLPPEDKLDFPHGTNTLGVLAAVGDNAHGVKGICHEATMLFASNWAHGEYLDTTEAGVEHAYDGLREAIEKTVGTKASPRTNHLGPGDVLVIEAQAEGGLPTEINPDMRAALQYIANTLQITVVLPAGNGESGTVHDLDTVAVHYIAASGHGNLWHDSDPDYAANLSHAIVVGAGGSGNASSPALARERVIGNHGQRVDCQGWGDYVATTNAGDFKNNVLSNPPNGSYTSLFNGTSSATAVVGGIVASLQGAYKDATGNFLTPSQMRTLLQDVANGWAHRGADPIGPLPSLRKLLVATDLIGDAYMRDSLADDGTEPYPGSVIWKSPDVIVLKSPTEDPIVAFGDWNKDPSRNEIVAGQDNYCYVRLDNRGRVATDASIELFWSPRSTFIDPTQWTQVDRVNPQRNVVGLVYQAQHIVTEAFVWHAADVPAEGHYCLIAVVQAECDPLVIPPSFPDVAAYDEFIQNHNNICFRNADVVPAAPGGNAVFAFLIRGKSAIFEDREGSAPLRLKIQHKVPGGRIIRVEASDPLPGTPDQEWKFTDSSWSLEAKIEDDAKVAITVTVEDVPGSPGDTFEIWAEQYVDEVRVGRVTGTITVSDSVV